MSTESAGPTRLRASDAEREEFARIVREAVGEGRLDISEGDERLAAIYAARFRDELRPIVTDLPQGQTRDARTSPGGGQGWPSPPERWAPGRYPMRRGWYAPLGVHTGLVALIALILVGAWALSSASFFWPVIPLVFLTLGLLRHWRWAAWRRHYWSRQPSRD